MIPFQPSRADGRSDRTVVYDLVKDAAPDTLFGYDVLTEALQDGLDDAVSHQRTLAAVRQARRDMLHKQQRLLRVVRGRGVRVGRSDEMLPAALEEKATAADRFKRGVDILRNTRLDELDEPMRNIVGGQLLVMDGFYQAIRASDRRQARVEKTIGDLLRRVQRLEGGDDDVES